MKNIGNKVLLYEKTINNVIDFCFPYSVDSVAFAISLQDIDSLRIHYDKSLIIESLIQS